MNIDRLQALPARAFSDGASRLAALLLSQRAQHPQSSRLAIRGAPVGQDRLETVADFDSHGSLVRCDEDQDAIVGALAPEAPFLKQFDGVVFDGRAVEACHGRNGDLDAGFVLDRAHQAFEPGARARASSRFARSLTGPVGLGKSASNLAWAASVSTIATRMGLDGLAIGWHGTPGWRTVSIGPIRQGVGWSCSEGPTRS